ncbi:unnamed protein product [Owenia fusiformis]|uniref:Protein arginine N-methyltransferase 6 n=1 Tax=Owenia fusiformis TaxID=6347 RepID=A0A8S4NLY9_OWEFU|nr:unnamed protein product [Owenia fusiformis]
MDSHKTIRQYSHNIDNMAQPKRARMSHGKDQDSEYFRSYSDIGIHEDMIADSVRTNAYRLAILRNFEKIRGKVVLDVGAGTGILSAFCVQAGAKTVYAVEASDMAEQIKRVAKGNNMAEKIIVLQSKMEDAELPEKVDVIVSEWMGYFLLYETMLPSVIYARDNWLKQNGLILPDSATLYMAPINHTDFYEERLTFWEKVEETFKVNMSSLVPYARKCLTEHIHVKTIPIENVLAQYSKIAHIDLNTVTTSQLSHMKESFTFQCYGCNTLHGFASWFKVEFSADVELSTSPYCEDTHWQQSVLYVDNPLHVEQDTQITGSVVLTPNAEFPRFLDIDLKYKMDNNDDVHKHYLMNDVIL